jgi:hypothetical protein
VNVAKPRVPAGYQVWKSHSIRIGGTGTGSTGTTAGGGQPIASTLNANSITIVMANILLFTDLSSFLFSGEPVNAAEEFSQHSSALLPKYYLLTVSPPYFG